MRKIIHDCDCTFDVVFEDLTAIEAVEGVYKFNVEKTTIVEAIFVEETRKALYKEQKSSTTIVKEERVYPNDPCPCGSGKKYKKCCGKNK